MKRLLCTTITLMTLLYSATAADPIKPVTIDTVITTQNELQAAVLLKDYRVVVEGKELSLPAGVVPALQGKGDVLIPLRAVGEALGYDITWNDERKAAHLDMSIASMDFPLHQSTYYRKGKLQIINLDMDYPMEDAPVVVNGVMYIPAKLFEEFLNDVTVDSANQIVIIEVQKAELAGTTGVM